jgi:hypothetical protein
MCVEVGVHRLQDAERRTQGLENQNIRLNDVKEQT